jgi:DNA phosphorothioation-associated putative methyltransferase
MDTVTDTVPLKGKTVGGKTYFHVSVVSDVSPEIQALYQRAIEVARIIPEKDFNVVRIDVSGRSLALLDYPKFFDEPYPILSRSWKIELDIATCNFRSYEESLNPPILHRKELLLPSTHPNYSTYTALTEEAERIGLFDDPVRIGFKVQWSRLLAERGFRVVDHHLVPIGNDEEQDEVSTIEEFDLRVARHRTALSRTGFSAPIQMLDYYGFLDGTRTVFDYGCGKGDDVRGLNLNNIKAQGWDPHYAPDNPIANASLVNLGFVINVIEDPVERREALTRAYALAKELIVVSVMLAAQAPENTKPFADGVLTSRNTFQKYFTQAELRNYLESVLGEDPMPVAPGVFFIFRNKDSEQRFNIARLRSQIRFRSLVRPERLASTEPSLRVRRPRIDVYEENRELFGGLWERMVNLGREPTEDEVMNLEAITALTGSLRRAIRLVLSKNDVRILEQAGKQRADDLRVYLAQQQFQKRKPYKHLENSLQLDVKGFFGNYSSAQNEARKILFSAADPRSLDEACRTAAERGLGWYEPSKSLQLHGSLVARLPAVLRAYVGCASFLYGDVSRADLVKIHIRSGKVSLMMYDDFLGTPLPRMVHRVKINLRLQEMDVFEYGKEYLCPLLYFKSRYINEELPNYAAQVAFDEKLESLKLIDLTGYGPPEAKFRMALETARWEVSGFELRRSQTIPNLDLPCGRFLTYRDLIETGETRHASKLPNLPKEPDSYTALYDLAENILDPTIEYFGMIKLTYGFCSLELARLIPSRIASELDQHAAHEKNRRGNYVCKRLGAAVDFLIEHENMEEVAMWIATNTPFDRIYYYGPQRPLHVSFGPERNGEFVEMRLQKNGRLIPHTRSLGSIRQEV